jgi:hypothetical protein
MSMGWSLVATALYDAAIADTGAGGLFASGNQQISAWYSNEAVANAPMPYAVARLVSTIEDDVFSTTPRTVTINYDVGVYSDKRVASSYVIHAAKVDRIIALFRRTTLTITGWTVSHIFYDGSPFSEPSDDTLYTVLSFSVTISK